MVTTVLNAAEGCAKMLESLGGQTRVPDEIIVVDGGSTDGTLDVLRQEAQRDARIRLLVKPGANIGQGRNAGIEVATGEIILSTDSGCRLDHNWVESMVRPFEEHPDTELVAGTYEIDPQTLTEAVVGTATMRGALKPIDPDTYNPSCRSLAFTKKLWERVGRFPDWIEIDDTLFNLKLRRMNVNRRIVRDAAVHWRPRSTLTGIYRQFRFYATWRGHTQLDAEAIHFNIRNLTVCLILLLAAIWFSVAWALFLAAFAYFYIYSFHDKARRVAAKLGTWKAYPLSIVVHWAIVLGGISGYLKASWQRLRDRERYQSRMEAYLAGT
ncbi:MAG: glycosyltransferase [Phycisphaerales bacterium]|nr:MAG: glycosyltransferase [Phycisphaerales bacterium]